MNKVEKVENKAEKVEAVYYTAALDELLCSESCYSLAVHAALELGGVEVQNANDGNRAVSCPPRIFVFDDGSEAYV